MRKLRLSGISTGVKASAIYTIASFITKGISIITIPIFTRIMSTEQIGIVTTYNSWVSILGAIISMGLTTASFSVAMHEYVDERDQLESSLLTLTSLSTLCSGLVYLIFMKQINKVLGLPSSLVILMLIGFFFQPATEFWMYRQRYEYKYKLCAIITLGTAIVSSLTAVFTVLSLNHNGNNDIAIGRLYATYLVYDIVALCLYIYIFIHGKTFFNKKYWKFAIRLSIPLMIHTLAKHLLDVSDKLMIQRICGNSKVGIYGTLYSVSSLSLIFWTAINVSLVPYMFSCMDNRDTAKAKLDKVIFPVMVVYGCASILFAFVSPEIVRIIATEEYYEAIYMVPPVAAGIYFTSLYSIMGNVLLYHKKTNYIMTATIVAAAINIVTNYIFINMFGYMAAAYTTLACNILLAVFQYFMAKRVSKEMPFSSKPLFILSMGVCIIVILCNLLYKTTLARFVILAILIAIVFVKRDYFIATFKSIKKK